MLSRGRVHCSTLRYNSVGCICRGGEEERGVLVLVPGFTHLCAALLVVATCVQCIADASGGFCCCVVVAIALCCG